MSTQGNRGYGEIALYAFVFIAIMSGTIWSKGYIDENWGEFGVAFSEAVVNITSFIGVVGMAFIIGAELYAKIWVGMANIKKIIIELQKDSDVAKEEIDTLRSRIRWADNECSDLSKKTHLLAKNIFKLKKFTGLDEIEKVEAAKKKVQKTMGVSVESNS